MPTTRPHLRSRMPGTNARVSSTALRSSRSLAFCHALQSCPMAVPVGGPPVLVTSTSTRPCAVIVRSTTSAMPSAVLRSATMDTTGAPSAVSRTAALSTDAASREQITSDAPSRAKSSAAAYAMPRLAPHTSATRPPSPRSTLLRVAEVRVAAVEPVLARRIEHGHVERVLERLGAMPHHARDHEHFARVHIGVHVARCIGMLTDPETQHAREDVRELFVVVIVRRHDRALLEMHVREHHALARDELA